MSTPITPVPDVILASEFPSLADRTAGVYNSKSAAWAGSENAMATRSREIAVTAHDNAVIALDSATAAAQSEQEAATSADASEASNQSALAIAGAIGADAGLPALAGNAGHALIVNSAGNGVSWGDVRSMMRLPISAAHIAAKGDHGAVIDCDGTFTLSFDAAETLGNGWFCYVKNGGDGDVTLAPDGAQTIDGLDGYIMYPGEVRLFQCDGAALRTILIAGEPTFIARDEKPSGTVPGQSTTTAWAQRTLNTVLTNSIFGASLALNVITLPAGRYSVVARAGMQAAGHRLRLYNITDSVAALLGSNGSSGGTNDASDSWVQGIIILSTSSVLRLEHWTQGSANMGKEANAGVPEVYAEITIRKLS